MAWSTKRTSVSSDQSKPPSASQSRTSAASINPRQAKTWPGLVRSTGIAASVVLARGLLVGGAQKRLPPGETPRPPAPLKPRKAQRDIAGPRFERGGRRVLATARVDYRPRLPVMSGNEMQDELAPLLRQRLKSGMPLRDREGSKLMPIAIQDRLIDRAARLGQGTGEAKFPCVAFCFESALPARRFLAFVMQERGNRQCVGGMSAKADPFGDEPRLPLSPALMLGKLLRS